MKSIGEKIADGIQKFYTAFINQRVLTTSEEVQANTNEKNLASAVVVGEIYNNLMQQPEWIKDSTGKITGYKTPGGADTVFPFKTNYRITFTVTTGLNRSHRQTSTGTLTIIDGVANISYAGGSSQAVNLNGATAYGTTDGIAINSVVKI